MSNISSKEKKALDNAVAEFEKEKRGCDREDMTIGGRIDLKGTHRSVQIKNLSANGALFDIDPNAAPPKKGQQLKLTITSPAKVIGDMLSVTATVIHIEDHEIGVHFDGVKPC